MKTLPAALLGLATALAVSCSKKTDVIPTADVVSDAAPIEAEKLTPFKDLASVYKFTMTDINGSRVNLGAYRGKKILIVNTASQCGYTPQYAELQTLYATYGSRVVVLGFPSNDFGRQEPGTNGQISAFCTGTYQVTFPMFSRIDVVGATAAPLYRFLGDQAQNGVLSDQPTWNFCKYLIDERGHVMRFYSSAVTPMSPTIVNDILAPPAFLATAQVQMRN